MSALRICLGAIEFGSRQWNVPVLVAIVVGFVLLAASYGRTSQSLAFRTALILLKACGITLVALCLLNPTLVRNQMRPGENIVVLLTDNSSSMQIVDNGDVSRGKRLQQYFQEDREEWLTRLTQDFDLRRYAFDERLDQVEDITDLEFHGQRSQMIGAMNSIQERFQNQPLAAVILMTDGNAGDAGLLDELKLEVPVYPVLDERRNEELFDVSIHRLSVSESPFEDSPITISATVSSTKAGGETPIVAILSRAHADDLEEPLSSKVVIPRGAEAAVKFEVKPKELGVEFYRLRVLPEDEQNAFEEDGLSSEATLKNNERLVVVNRRLEKNRLIYVGGRPNWEYKFFNRAIEEDREVDLVSLIRIAKKEAKFDFRGRVGEEANSLFRGQDREVDAETESYDQAVVIRLSPRDKEELQDGFPKTKEELYRYDAVILDDIEAEFFTPDQQTLLDRFVSERGGGLMMLGGRDSFHHGQWQKTPLRDALPVYLDREDNSPSGELKWQLTREGWLEPWMRVRATEEEENRRLELIPDLEILNPMNQTKPGARVFAMITDQNREQFPAVVAQQYGLGRSVAVLVGDLWKWSIHREDSDGADDLARTWRQMIRWMVAEIPQRVEIELEWTQLGNVPAVRLQVRIRDAEFQPKENAAVSVSVSQPDGKSIELDAEPSLVEAGLFETTFVPRQTGAYVADVQVTDETELAPQMAKIGWTSEPEEQEFRDIIVNEALLTRIAEQSGGELISASQLPDFVRSLPQKEMPVTEIKTTPLWHSPLILLLALACFAAEWGLRRWRGLP